MFLYFTRGTINADRHLYPDDPSMVEFVLDHRMKAPSFSGAAESFHRDTGGDLTAALRRGATGDAFFDRSLQKCFFTLVGELAQVSSRRTAGGLGFFSAGILAAGPLARLFSATQYWSDLRTHIGVHFDGLKRWEAECDWTQVVLHTKSPIASSAGYRGLETGSEDEVVLKDRRGRFCAVIAGERSAVSAMAGRIDAEIGLSEPASLEGRPINAAHTSFSDRRELEQAAQRFPFGQPVCDLYGADGSILRAHTGTQQELARFFVTAIDGPLDTRSFLDNVRRDFPVLLAIGSERALRVFEGIDRATSPEIRLLTTSEL